jgi:hypothetical protein
MINKAVDGRHIGRTNRFIRRRRDSAMSDYGYSKLKLLAGRLKVGVSELLALSQTNDPFYAGLPGRKADAEWFARLWSRFSFQPGIHLRGIHYAFVSQRKPLKFPNGMPYENTFSCWHKLTTAARDARHLGLVPVDGWVDRKAAAFEYLVEAEPARVPILVDDQSFTMPGPPELGLERPVAQQPYQVELWTEKSGISDLLRSLADDYKLNAVVGEGEISVVQCDNLVGRALKSGRPVRILYISDFDPAGQSMPVAAARKIEHALHRRKLRRLDIQVRPVALSREQVIALDIPSIPLKESERRAASFHEQHGEMAAELDALEVLHPGELRRILVGEIERYFDADLQSATDTAADAFEEQLAVATESVHDRHRDALDELEEAWGEVQAVLEAWQERSN